MTPSHKKAIEEIRKLVNPPHSIGHGVIYSEHGKVLLEIIDGLEKKIAGMGEGAR